MNPVRKKDIGSSAADFPLLRMKKSKRPMYKPTMESSDNTAVRKPVVMKKPVEKPEEPKKYYYSTLEKIEKKVKYKPKSKPKQQLMQKMTRIDDADYYLKND